ncbi:YmfQ family protein [Clostridium chromiireducens]|uniref:YmfQ family protein n=1 Tax=Clostridium chromiireducens TaxID=225345 RepID=UPI003AF5B3BC
MYGSSTFGVVQYGVDSMSNEDIINKAPDLMKYMPEYYQKSIITNMILNSQSHEMGQLILTIEDIERQLYIKTATWGLKYWEDIYNISTNLNLSYEARREVIIAKKRGRGTVTKQMLKNTAIAFSGGDVEIIEQPEIDSFTVNFIGIKGIPQNMAGFLNMLEDIKPAHLGYDIKYSYTVWDVVEQKNLKWNGVKTSTWNQLKTYE